MSILNKPINPGGQLAFSVTKDAISSFQDARHGLQTAVRFNGLTQQSTSAIGRFCYSLKRQPQTLGKASNYVGMEDGQLSTVHEGLMDEKAITTDQKMVRFQPLTLTFLQSLLQKKRTSTIADDEAGKGNGSASQTQPLFALKVIVSSAVKLDTRQMDLIARKMQRLTGFQNLRMENVIDQSLIAGFVINYGSDESQVIDLSVKGQLAALKTRVESVEQRTI